MQSPFQEGAVLLGKYRVERVLGQGGMGIVVAAWHLRLEQRVAIKILRPELIQNREVVERFLREARAASKIEGDHVVRVTDVETLEDGTPFMVMEYLEGRDLAWVRERGQALLPADAVDYLLQACEAIAEAHAHGVIHRDIKPGNIFLARRRDGRTRIKVLDFGISKLADASGASANLTATEAIMGSAEYMSPEQMQSSRDVDERTDIWALGVSLYELCTGVGPFEAPSLREVCVRVLAGQPAPPRSVRPELSPGLEAVILRCLQKDREGRYATIAALRSALLPFSSSALVTPLPSAPPPAYAQAPGLPAASASPWGAAPGALPQGAPSASPYAAPSASPYAAPNASPYTAAPSASPYAAPSASPYAAPNASPKASPFAVAPSASPSAGAAPRLGGLPLPLVIGAGALLVLTVLLAFVLGRGHGGAEAEGASSAAPSASAPAGTGRYQIEAELIVDGKTGLRWQRRPPLGTMSFSAAKSYCASARGNGFRLPTQEELALLARAARQNLSAPSEVFHSLASDYFWTGSTVEQDPKLYWIVRAGDGDATTSSPSGVARVRCVR